MTATNLTSKWPTWAPHLLSVLRIVVAFLFILSAAGAGPWSLDARRRR